MPPQQLLQKQGDERRSSTLSQTKGRRAEVLENCLQQRQNSYRRCKTQCKNTLQNKMHIFKCNKLSNSKTTKSFFFHSVSIANLFA